MSAWCTAEKTVPSGLASLVLAVIPLLAALAEMLLPGGEPLPARGWLGMALGFAGLAALVWPSLRTGLPGTARASWPSALLLIGAFAWTAGSLLSRRARLPVNSFVAAAWQMLIAGAFNTALGTALGQWPEFHVNAASVGSLAWLITGGSLLGYTAFIYLLEHVPVAKVASYAYVNPVIAVLLGIVLLHERPESGRVCRHGRHRGGRLPADHRAGQGQRRRSPLTEPAGAGAGRVIVGLSFVDVRISTTRRAIQNGQTSGSMAVKRDCPAGGFQSGARL